MKARMAPLTRWILLLLPLVLLAAQTLWLYARVAGGVAITLPVTGVDPRDLLSGHYLSFSIQWPLPTSPCPDHLEETALCVAGGPPRYREDDTAAAACTLWVRGSCRGGQFHNGLERYYVPEAQAAKLERAIMDHRAAVVLSVQQDSGEALIRELLIDGMIWHQNPEFLSAAQAP
ncbi:MAG: GDYXXLXY domain-containing protein [Magnetococcus sp. WYHC-3]